MDFHLFRKGVGGDMSTGIFSHAEHECNNFSQENIDLVIQSTFRYLCTLGENMSIEIFQHDE